MLVRGLQVGDHFLRIQTQRTRIFFRETLEVELAGETVEAFFLEILEVHHADAGFVRDAGDGRNPSPLGEEKIVVLSPSYEINDFDLLATRPWDDDLIISTSFGATGKISERANGCQQEIHSLSHRARFFCGILVLAALRVFLLELNDQPA